MPSLSSGNRTSPQRGDMELFVGTEEEFGVQGSRLMRGTYLSGVSGGGLFEEVDTGDEI